MDKFQQSLNQSIRHLQVADHMTYVTYPLINEKRLLLKKIQEIIEISNRHKESAMEFVRNEKIVILSNSLGTKILDIQQVKGYLLIAKELLLKVNQRMDKITN